MPIGQIARYSDDAKSIALTIHSPVSFMSWFSVGSRISCFRSFLLIYFMPSESAVFVFYFSPMVKVNKKLQG